MTEAQIAFLLKAASNLPHNNQVHSVLESHYLTKCKEMTKGYALPQKFFSPLVRCPYCCTAWKTGTETRMKPIKLSKKQRRRLKIKEKTNVNNKNFKSKMDLLNSCNVEQTCAFCNHINKIPIIKPEKEKPNQNEVSISNNERLTVMKEVTSNIKNTDTKNTAKQTKQQPRKNSVQSGKREPVASIYKTARDVFNLNNKNNTIKSVLNKETKVLKNNKKRKEKFAGLNAIAVLAAAKIKEERENQNKLNANGLKPCVW